MARSTNIPGGMIVWNDAGFQAILKSDQIVDVIEVKAQEMVDAANEVGGAKETKRYGYKIGVTDRARGIVFTASRDAKNSNAKHNTLIKVMGGVSL